MQATIIADKRERQILSLDGVTDIPVRAEHLTVGDFLLLLGERVFLVIERKTWADLAASIKDGRINNIAKLREYRAETGAQIAYLLEGPQPAPGDVTSGIPARALRAHLDHLFLRDQVQLIYTLDLCDSLRRLGELAAHAMTIREWKSLESSESAGSSHLALAKKKIPLTLRQARTSVFSTIRGVSKKTAELLVEQGIRPADLYSLDKDVLIERLKGIRDPAANRGLGSARINALCEARNDLELQRALVQAIPGFSLKTAAAFLKSHPLLYWVKDWNVAEARAVTIGGRRISARCIDYFSKIFGMEIDQVSSLEEILNP